MCQLLHLVFKIQHQARQASSCLHRAFILALKRTQNKYTIHYTCIPEFIPVGINYFKSLVGSYRQFWIVSGKNRIHGKVIEASNRIQGGDKQVQESN